MTQCCRDRGHMKEIAVGEHYTLWFARRTRGVNECCDLLVTAFENRFWFAACVQHANRKFADRTPMLLRRLQSLCVRYGVGRNDRHKQQ